MKRKQPSPQPQSQSMDSDTTKTPSLPLKTIQDILSRLPVKSITRFESVSKRWLSIIRSPEFISAHLRRSSLFPSLLIRRFHNPTGSNFALSSITNDGSISYREINVPFFGSLFRFPLIVSSCNGILCIDVSLCSASGFVLWNLTTGQFRILPKPLISEGLESKFWMVASGFGYNSVVDDYKVVRVVSFQNSSTVRAEVFELNVGSWRLIDQNAVDDGIGSCVISEGEQAVNVNGGLHWIANGIGKSSGFRFLVSFDMGTDSFVRLKTPDVSENVCMKLMSFKDSVALALYPALPVYPGYGRSVDRIELWVLDDCVGGGMDGKKWSKLHSIPSGFSQLACPIEILNDSELVLKRVENDVITLSFYNPGKQTVKRFPICSNEFSCQVYSYVDSLVPVFMENEAVLEDGQ